MSTTGFEINLSDVPEGYGGDLPAGNFVARLLSSPEMTETKGDNNKPKLPMLSARFEIVDGELKGKEQVLRYVFAIEVKDGKPKYSTGIIAYKRDVKAIGEQIPEGFKLNDKNAVKYYGTKFKDKLVVLNVSKYKPRGWKDGEDLSTGYKITGLATGSNGMPAGLAQLPAGAVATAASNPGAEFEDDETFD